MKLKQKRDGEINSGDKLRFSWHGKSIVFIEPGEMRLLFMDL